MKKTVALSFLSLFLLNACSQQENAPAPEITHIQNEIGKQSVNTQNPFEGQDNHAHH